MTTKAAEDLELFGTGPHLELQMKLARLEPILIRTAGLFNGGRTFGVEADHPFSKADLSGFVEEFGMIGLYFVERDALDDYDSAAKEAGYSFQVWNVLESTAETPKICEEIVGQQRWPDDWSETLIDRTTDTKSILAFQELAQAQGVSGPPGYMLRGTNYETVSLLIHDADDRPVVTAYSTNRHGQLGRFAHHFFTGMIAVDPKFRGRGLGSLALARVIEQTYDIFDVANVHAGVKADNGPSNGMCNRCGLQYQGRHITIVTNPNVFKGAFTR